MQTSKLLMSVLMACAWVGTLHAQTGRAKESAPPAPTAPGQPMPIENTLPPLRIEDTPAQKRALQALRKAMAQPKTVRTSTSSSSYRVPLTKIQPSQPVPQVKSSTPSQPAITGKVGRQPLSPSYVNSPPPPKTTASPRARNMESKPAPPPMPAAPLAPAAPQAVPSPVLSAKEQRLAALLEEYRADKITPGEYQERRAKILAGP